MPAKLGPAYRLQSYRALVGKTADAQIRALVAHAGLELARCLPRHPNGPGGAVRTALPDAGARGHQHKTGWTPGSPYREQLETAGPRALGGWGLGSTRWQDSGRPKTPVKNEKRGRFLWDRPPFAYGSRTVSYSAAILMTGSISASFSSLRWHLTWVVCPPARAPAAPLFSQRPPGTSDFQRQRVWNGQTRWAGFIARRDVAFPARYAVFSIDVSRNGHSAQQAPRYRGDRVARKTCSVVPNSTTWPRYITITRSDR